MARPKQMGTIDDLTLDVSNVMTHPERNQDVLANSLEQFGAARSVVEDGDGIIRAGNGTVQAARRAGIKKIKYVDGNPDELIVVRRKDLKGPAAIAYSIADNRTSQLARWDEQALLSTLEGLGDEGILAEALGFNAADLESLSFLPTDEPQSQLDHLETPPQQFKCPECGYQWEVGRRDMQQEGS